MCLKTKYSGRFFARLSKIMSEESNTMEKSDSFTKIQIWLESGWTEMDRSLTKEKLRYNTEEYLKNDPEGRRPVDRPKWWDQVQRDIRSIGLREEDTPKVKSYGGEVLLRPSTDWGTNGHGTK